MQVFRRLWFKYGKTLWEPPPPEREKHRDWDPDEFNKGKRKTNLLRGIQLLRRNLGQILEGKRSQELLATVILLDSCVVFLECIVDSIIDDRKDMAGTWLHFAYVLNYVLEFLNVSFLVIFVTELGLLLFAFGGTFFKQTVYVLDLSMVLASLLADLYKPYFGVKGEHAFTLLLRVWRIIRIAHGVFMVMEVEIEITKKEVKALRQENAELRRRLGMSGRASDSSFSRESSSSMISPNSLFQRQRSALNGVGDRQRLNLEVSASFADTSRNAGLSSPSKRAHVEVRGAVLTHPPYKAAIVDLACNQRNLPPHPAIVDSISY